MYLFRDGPFFPGSRSLFATDQSGILSMLLRQSLKGSFLLPDQLPQGFCNGRGDHQALLLACPALLMPELSDPDGFWHLFAFCEYCKTRLTYTRLHQGLGIPGLR